MVISADQIVAMFELLILFASFFLSAINAVLLKMYAIPNSINRVSEIYLEVLTCTIYSPVPVLRILEVNLSETVFTNIAAYFSIWVFFVCLNASVVKHFGILLVVANPGQYSGMCPLLNITCLVVTTCLSAVQCLVFWGKYGLHTSGLYAAFKVRDSDRSIIFPYLSFIILYFSTHVVCTLFLNCKLKLSPYVGQENQRMLRRFFVRFWLNRTISWVLIFLLPLVDMLSGDAGTPWSYHVCSVILCKMGILERNVEMLVDILRLESRRTPVPLEAPPD